MISLTAAPANAADCTGTGTGLTPLTELGTGTYQGFEGGLYPGGSNEPPAAHLDLGLRAAAEVQPRAADGTPDPGGRIGIVSIGVSNTRTEFAGFVDQAADFAFNPQVWLVNGAQGSTPLEDWALGARPWDRLLDDLGRRLTPEQVQAAWIKLPAQRRGTPDLGQIAAEVEMLAAVVRTAAEMFPNLRLVYLSSRTYGGYANRGGGEPTAYQHGFVIKRLIENQINGEPELNADPDAGAVIAPWLAWGPYLWADGLNARADGLVWECSDFTQDDGIHPAQGAVDKVGTLLLQHFTTHLTTRWFASTAAIPRTSTTTPGGDSTTTTTEARATSIEHEEDSTTRDQPSRQSDRPGSTVPVADAALDPGADSAAQSGGALVALMAAGLVVVAGIFLTRVRARRRSEPPST